MLTNKIIYFNKMNNFINIPTYDRSIEKFINPYKDNWQRRYYKSLFDKIKKLPAKRVLTERVRINNGRKFGLMINCMVQNKMNWV